MANILPDADYYSLVRKFLEVRDEIKRENDMRRLMSNDDRATANRRDVGTNLVVREVNEELPLPVDYRPIDPVPPMPPVVPEK